MHVIHKQTIVCGLVVLFWTSPVDMQAGPQSAFNFEALSKSAQVVVIGKIEQIRGVGEFKERFGETNITYEQLEANCRILDVLNHGGSGISEQLGQYITVSFLRAE